MEVNELAQLVREGFQGTHARLDRLNDRIYTHEGQIAALEERTDSTEQKATWTKGSVAKVGAGGTLLIAVLSGLFDKLFHYLNLIQ